MNDTHSDIMARLMPLYEMAPERFMAFYDAVYLMCIDLPEGEQFRISDRCQEKDLKLFQDIVKHSSQNSHTMCIQDSWSCRMIWSMLDGQQASEPL